VLPPNTYQNKEMLTTAPSIRSLCRQILRAVAFVLSLTALTTAIVQAGDVTLVETGSTLLYPLFNIWVESLTKTHPGFHTTADATGSEVGIKKLISGEAQIGALDVFMFDKEVRQNPQVVNIPLCISAQMINYNIPWRQDVFSHRLANNRRCRSGRVLAPKPRRSGNSRRDKD
jgi:ABC-type phosphate transport system substrate-binding protein